MRAQFGNASPVPDGEYGDGEAVTSIDFGDIDAGEALLTMTAPDGIVANHAHEAPTWVSSDDEELARQLGDHYGCPVRPYEGAS